ncbi:MAG TPA: PspC domain-containing protein [Firmicutes bacterium]|jgi:phage shock protein C|nr:PspC domain-containing protein [Bacillota bacterium]
MKRGRLYRSRQERMIAGVAGGLAEYFEVDVALIRLLWLITFFMGGGFIAYLLAWFVIPERPTELSAEDQSTIDLDERAENQEELDKRWRFGGLVLIVAGLIFLLREILPWRLLGRNLLPVALIVVGLFILFNGFKSNKQG